MLDRAALVAQMAKAFTGGRLVDQTQPSDETRDHADDALSRVELYLGVDIEQAKDILTRVLEDVS